MITAGIDIGSVSSQAVVLCDGRLYAYSNMHTGPGGPNSALEAINGAMEGTGLALDQIHYTVGTGYGRVNVPFARKAVTEIACHARGGNYIFGPTLRTILDMGGQDLKAIRCDEKGKVITFLMNDKCAAGTGRGLEVMADLLGVPIDEIGARSLSIDQEPEPVSNTCVIYAKSEATRLLRAGWSVEKVLAAYCLAMARRVAALLKQVDIEEDFAITGGIAKNIGIVSRLERILGIKALTTDEYDTQIAGALGAALFAWDIVKDGAAE